MGGAVKKLKSLVLEVPRAINRRIQGAWSFYPHSFEEARMIILTERDGLDTDARWEGETQEEMDAICGFIHDGSMVCDFGIGIGRISREILRDFPGVRIVGVDSSKPMLKYCRKFIPREYHDRLRLLHFSKMRSIETASVDFAFSIYVLQHVLASRFRRSLEELRRIVKPGGLLYLLNLKHRCVNDRRRRNYDDGLPQLEIISNYFDEVRDVGYESAYMNKTLESHFSKLFIRPAGDGAK